MGLALDEPKKDDKTYDVDGLTIVVDASEDQDVMRRGGVRVDHRVGWWGSSFVVSPTYGDCC